MNKKRKKRLSSDEYVAGISKQNRFILSKAITLIESNRLADHILAQEVINKIVPFSGKSKRIGITGVPGVGKSTFIETFGEYLIHLGHKVAVLAIDPSSQKTKGSILGDKTRMEKLAHNPVAYIRPSASGQTIGGVAKKTRETMLLCEAAGFDIIIIETVGVGQSEVEVRNLVDFFLLLMLAGAGDELQGIKKGIMEMADTIAINKADGHNLAKAKLAMKEYSNALHLFRTNESGWYCKTTYCSAIENSRINNIWEIILQFWKEMSKNNWIITNRKKQNLSWMHTTIQQNLIHSFYQNSEIQSQIEMMENLITDQQIQPHTAAEKLLIKFFNKQIDIE